YRLVQEFVHQGNNVTVISPQKIQLTKKNKSSYGKEIAKVYRPKILSLSNKSVLGYNTYNVSRYTKVSAIRRCVRQNKLEYDVIYCHFISNALFVAEALKDTTKPIYVAVGEYNNIDIIKSYYKKQDYFQFFRKITGFIAVSPQI